MEIFQYDTRLISGLYFDKSQLPQWGIPTNWAVINERRITFNRLLGIKNTLYIVELSYIWTRFAQDSSYTCQNKEKIAASNYSAQTSAHALTTRDIAVFSSAQFSNTFKEWYLWNCRQLIARRIDAKSTLLQLVATSDYPSKCWHRSMLAYGVTRWNCIFRHQRTNTCAYWLNLVIRKLVCNCRWAITIHSHDDMVEIIFTKLFSCQRFRFLSLDDIFQNDWHDLARTLGP